MAGEIEFTGNYSDLSTDNGFQLELHCNRCGNGYRTELDTGSMSAAAAVLDGASSLLGGIFGQGADAAQRVQSAAWEKAGDEGQVPPLVRHRPKRPPPAPSATPSCSPGRNSATSAERTKADSRSRATINAATWQ